MILENINNINEELQNWKSYREQNDILIDFDDFQLENLSEGEKRDLESKAKKALNYGGAAFFGLAGSAATGGVGAVGVGLGLVSMWIYRELTDECNQKCGKSDNPKKCKYECYANAASETINRLENTAKKKLKDIEDEKDREKAERKLVKKIQKYKKKKEKYENKAREASGYVHK